MSITRNNIRSAEDAVIYLTDCTLATVEHMAMLKSKKKGEFERQISIAQVSIDFIKSAKTDVKGNSRITEILQKFSGNVTAWATGAK